MQKVPRAEAVKEAVEEIISDPSYYSMLIKDAVTKAVEKWRNKELAGFLWDDDDTLEVV